jgi:hypothetical protein
MNQLRCYGDERQKAMCPYCAGDTLTRDHVPPRVFLDQPYPDNLPVVRACRDCNQGCSMDEEYVACLVDCMQSGTASPEEGKREKIKRILLEKPALVADLETALSGISRAQLTDHIETRLISVALKLARGHALFELNDPQFEEPSRLVCAILPRMPGKERTHFEYMEPPRVFPEVGSRGMQRLVAGLHSWNGWIVVQPGRYRYAAFINNSVCVRIVLSEYLACEVVW